MMDDSAARALEEMRAAVADVREGRVDQPGKLQFEGVRAYSVQRADIRRPTPQGVPAAKKNTSG